MATNLTRLSRPRYRYEDFYNRIMIISIIVAVAENNVIGAKNKLPWYLPADLKHFKKITTGHHIVMGQNTYEGLGKPLPSRINIVLSYNPNFKAEGCIVANSPEEAVNVAKKAGEDELMICGGAQVYKTFLPIADRIYMTKVKAKIEGDTLFPKIGDEWKVISRASFAPDAKNRYPYEFLILERV